MAYHEWGDDLDWHGLNEAIDYIGLGLRKWGRCNVLDFKEKYGNCRIYLSFGFSQIHTLIYPGYCYCQFKNKKLWSFDIYHGYKIMRLINWAVIPYQKWLYRYLHKKMVKKYPHLHDEILDDADFPELLKNL